MTHLNNQGSKGQDANCLLKIAKIWNKKRNKNQNQPKAKTFEIKTNNRTNQNSAKQQQIKINTENQNSDKTTRNNVQAREKTRGLSHTLLSAELTKN